MRHRPPLGPRGPGPGASGSTAPAHAVRPYVLRNKTDRNDTKAILEAHRNEDIRPVSVKSLEQHIIASLHRLRSAWMAMRTARMNDIRGLLREFSLTIPCGARRVVPHVHAVVSDADSGVPDSLRGVLAEVAHETSELESRVRQIERQLEALAPESPVITRLRPPIPGMEIPGARVRESPVFSA